MSDFTSSSDSVSSTAYLAGDNSTAYIDVSEYLTTSLQCAQWYFARSVVPFSELGTTKVPDDVPGTKVPKYGGGGVPERRLLSGSGHWRHW